MFNMHKTCRLIIRTHTLKPWFKHKRFCKFRLCVEEASADLGHIPALPIDKPTWIVDPIDGTQNFVHGDVYGHLHVQLLCIFDLKTINCLKVVFKCLRGWVRDSGFNVAFNISISMYYVRVASTHSAPQF